MFELGEIGGNIRIFYLKGNRFNSHNVSIPKNTPEDSIAPRSIVTHSLISFFSVVTIYIHFDCIYITTTCY